MGRTQTRERRVAPAEAEGNESWRRGRLSGEHDWLRYAVRQRPRWARHSACGSRLRHVLSTRGSGGIARGLAYWMTTWFGAMLIRHLAPNWLVWSFCERLSIPHESSAHGDVA